MAINSNLFLLKSKLKAAAFHSLITCLVMITCGYLVYWVWYPGGLAGLVGGSKLFGLVVMIEVGLGPLMSLIIFNPSKSVTEMVRDYAFVGAVQLLSLVYGLYAVAESRPAYLVFVKDRIEVVTAIELRSEDFSEVYDAVFSHITWGGPERICVEYPTDTEERNQLLFSAISGRDVQLYPKFYRYCKSGEIEAKTYPGERLRLIVSASKDASSIELPTGYFTWLPVKHRFGVWVEIYPNNDLTKGFSVKIDPFVAIAS